MKVKIWGCRGSIPAPLNPKHIEEKITQAIHQMPAIDTADLTAVQSYVQGLDILSRRTAGGNTTCVQIEAAGQTFIVDAGTGIRELGIELMKGPCGRGHGELHLFFSHPHWDHIQGFPFFNPAYISGNSIFIYSVHDLNMALVDQQRFLNFPVPMSIMPAEIEFITLTEGEPIYIGDVRIGNVRNAHPGHSYAYRFEDEHSAFVFASDSEYKELANGSVQPHLAFFKEADALLFDAQYSLNEGWIKEEWGHSSAMIGVDMALTAGVKRLILFHHDPEYDDDMLQELYAAAEAYRDEIAPKNSLEILIAYEGLALDLTPTGAVGAQPGEHQGAPILVSTSVFDEQSVQSVVDSLIVVDTDTTSKSRIIDLSQTETLTTASLKELVNLQHAEDRLPLILAAPSPSAMRVIELGGFLDFFAIYPTVEAAQAAVAARESVQLPGQILGNRYLIERVLAERRMGAVLGAVDQQQSIEVAVRIIDPAFSDEALDRLFVHRDHLLNASHPNLLRIHDLAREEHTTYIIEDYHQGQTLEALLAEHPQGIPLDQGLEIVRAIVAGMAYAHGQGIVHSNLGVEKIFVDDQGVKIGGMALGHLEGRFNLMEVPLLRQDAAYLAPEQVLAQTIDARTDLYALGVILYQLLTGRLPFLGSESELLQAHLEQDPLPPRELNGRISPSLSYLILKLMSKSPADRYGSAVHVQRLLAALSIGEGLDASEGQQTFVGREAELQQLDDKWRAARSGRGQLLFISGEQGVGKTRLAEQFAHGTAAPVILTGRCPQEFGDPFAPFAEALLAYLATPPLELYDAQAQELINQFTPIIPAVHDLLPGLSDLPPLEPQQEQLRRMSGITRFIAHAAAARPWILILDDLQWADDSTIALLHYLSFDLAHMPILILGTLRQSALQQKNPLSDLLRKLSSHPSVSQVDLDRLGRAGLGQILATQWDQAIPTDLVEAIYDHTGGNPLFVNEVIQTLEAEKLVAYHDGSWLYPPLDAVQLPNSVLDVVRRRVRTLPTDTQTLLQQAAVLGQTFNIELLKQLSELERRPLLEHLDLALQDHFIEEVAAAGAYCFQHHEIWRALYEDLPAVRLQLWHKIAAESLESSHHENPDAIAAALATHFLAAEMPYKGIPYAHQAATQAQSAYNNEVAITRYRQLLQALHGLELEERKEFISLQTSTLLNLGQVLELTGAWGEAGERYAAALHLAAENGDWLMQSHCQIAIGELARKRGDYATARSWFESALSISRQVDDKAGVANSLNNLGELALLQGDPKTAVDHLQEARSLLQEIGGKESMVVNLITLGNALREINSFAEANAVYQEGLSICRVLGQQRYLAYLLENIGGLFALQGQDELGLRLAGAGSALRETLATPLTAVEEETLQKTLAPAKERLGKQKATVALNAGSALSLEEAIDLALSYPSDNNY